jgi:hypothetical protein
MRERNRSGVTPRVIDSTFRGKSGLRTQPPHLKIWDPIIFQKIRNSLVRQGEFALWIEPPKTAALRLSFTALRGIS